MLFMEHTVRYYEPVAQPLSRYGFPVAVFNPLLLKGYGSNSLRNVKTYRRTPKRLRGTVLTTGRRCVNINLWRELKTRNRQFQLATKNKTAFANTLTSLLNQSFPNARRFFTGPARKDGSQKWADFVITFWHLDCVRSVSLNVSRRTQFTTSHRVLASR